MCSRGWVGFKRSTSVRPAAYDRRKMRKLRDAGPGRTKMIECNCLHYLQNIKRENPPDNQMPRIKSEDVEQAPMARLSSSSRQPWAPTIMDSPHQTSRSQRTTPTRIKYDLSSSGASAADSDDSDSSFSEFRPSRSPARIGLTPAPTTRSKSTVRDESLSVEPFSELPKSRKTFTLPIRVANRKLASNSLDQTSPTTSGAAFGASRPKKHKFRSPKKDKTVARDNQAPTDGLFSPPPSSDVEEDLSAPRSPKGKGKAVNNERAKYHGGEHYRGRKLERNPDGSRARTRLGDTPKDGNFRVKKKKHKSKKERHRNRLARDARVEPSIEETPSSQLFTTPETESSSPAGPEFPASPVSPIPARFVAPMVEPATPGPSRSRVFGGGATETPQSSCSLFVTQPRKRSSGKRSHDDFTVKSSFTVDSLSETFAQHCRPFFTEIAEKTESIRTETEGLKKRVKKTESDLNTFTARLDAQSVQVRNLGQKTTQTEARVQTLEQHVALGSLDDYRRENQELRAAVNTLRQQHQEENAQREERIKQEILDEFNSGLAKQKAEFTVSLAKHKAEQQVARRLDQEQQAIADHERTKNIDAQSEKLSQILHNSLRAERESRHNQIQYLKNKVPALSVPDRPPLQEPPRVMHGPFIPEIRPPEFYGLAHRNGMNPPVPGTIPDTLVRALSRPGRAQHSHPTSSGPSYNPPTWPTDQPSAQLTNHPPARPIIHNSAQPPNQRQGPATQPPTRQGTQLPMRPHSHTHSPSPRRSPSRPSNGSSPAPRSIWKPINKGPNSCNPRPAGGGSSSQQRGS